MENTIAFEVKSLLDVKNDNDLLNKLKVLSLNDGESHFSLTLERIHRTKIQKLKSSTVILMYVDMNLIGWALIQLKTMCGKYACFTGYYIHEDYRRRGFGSKLLNQARHICFKVKKRKMYVCPWDFVSRMFFKKNHAYNSYCW